MRIARRDVRRGPYVDKQACNHSRPHRAHAPSFGYEVECANDVISLQEWWLVESDVTRYPSRHFIRSFLFGCGIDC